MASSVDSPIAFVPAAGCLDNAAVVAPEEAPEHAGLEPHVEPRTFGEIYDTHFAFVWRMARRLGVPTAALEDAAQEVFVVVHRRLHDRPAASPLRPWLYAIVLNVSRAHRRVARKSSIELPWSQTDAGLDNRLADPAPYPDESAARAEAMEAIDAMLGELPEERLEVFVLSELEQLSVPQIAELLDVNVNTVYARRRAARQAFEEAVARHRARDGWRFR
jgi:RNA polymerase sigma-70 factor (ECF subfamily)